jgi:RimJ/RimL family protein N-acetyltransferase
VPEGSVAARTARALQALAAQEAQELPSRAQIGELMHDAAQLLGCLEPREEDSLSRRRTRWRLLLRRALHAAAASYRRALGPIEPRENELVEELRRAGLEPRPGDSASLDLPSSVALAERLAPGERQGLRSIVVLGPAPALAAALSRLTLQRVLWIPWQGVEAPQAGAALEGFDVDPLPVDPLDPVRELPAWLRSRFQTAVVRPPTAGLGAPRSLLMALAALAPEPQRRVVWTGHPGRHLSYFELYAVLGRRGLVLESLRPDAATVALDEDFAHQLLADLIETPEVAERLDPEPLEGLLAAGTESEHAHIFRPIEEVLLRGHRLDLAPLSAQDIPVLDGWLTPEMAAQIGFDETRPRPTAAQLALPRWYPGNEWWIARTKEGQPVGMANLILGDFWTKRSLPFDAAIPEPSAQGRGLFNDLLRLVFYRVFEQLGAERLWANVSLNNERVRRGHRSNFFRVVRRYVSSEGGEELEHIEITAEEYRERRIHGEIDVPLD